MRFPSIRLKQKAAANSGILLKGPQTYLLTGTHPGLQWRDGDLGGARDIQGETELCGFMGRATGTAATIPSVEPTSHAADEWMPSFVLNSPPTRPNLNLFWPSEICLLHPADSLGPCPTQLALYWKHFQQQKGSLSSACALPKAVSAVGRQPQPAKLSFLDSSQEFSGPRWAAASLGVL